MSLSASDGSDHPHIMLIAGEPSGDALGEQLMIALKAQTSGKIRITGVGGERMAGQGLVTLFPLDDTAVVGLQEILPKLPLILRRIRQVADVAADQKPDAVVLIDAPDFTHRIGKRLKKIAPEIPIIKYVAPQVWANRPWRAKSMSRFVDHLLALLPFEPEFFEKYGLECSFVGHPAVERDHGITGGEDFKVRHGIAQDQIVLGVLPGSRSVEIRYLLPLFKATVRQLSSHHPGLHTIVPTVPHVADRVRAMAADWPTPITLIEGDSEKFSSFDAMDVALAASGTVSTELALASVPSIIAYKVGWITGFIFERLVDVPFASLVSIVLGREIFPEFIQGQCTSDNLVTALDRLILDEARQENQRKDMAEAVKMMGQGDTRPSERAATAILQVIESAAP